MDVAKRWSELLTYAAMAGGLVVGLEFVAFGYHRTFGGLVYFEQTRYLLALIPLYGALVAVAAPRWGRPLGRSSLSWRWVTRCSPSW